MLYNFILFWQFMLCAVDSSTFTVLIILAVYVYPSKLFWIFQLQTCQWVFQDLRSAHKQRSPERIAPSKLWFPFVWTLVRLVHASSPQKSCLCKLFKRLVTWCVPTLKTYHLQQLLSKNFCQINLGSFFSLVMSKICEVFSSLLVGSGVGGGALHPWDSTEVWSPVLPLIMSSPFLAVVTPIRSPFLSSEFPECFGAKQYFPK